MAETIGRAYIKILADGSGMGESIRRELKDSDVDKAARQGGEDFSKSYAKGYEDEERKSKNFSKSLGRTLNRGFHEMNENAGTAGARAGKITAERMAQNIERRLRASFPDLDKVAGDLGKRMGDAMRNDFILHGKFTKDFDTFLQQAMKDQKSAADEWEANWRRDLNKITTNIDKTTRAIESDMDKIAVKIDNTRDVMHRSSLDMDRDWVRTSETIRREMDKTNHSQKSFIERMDLVSAAVGKAFGKGSRNNFLNFVGSFVGGAVGIGGSLAKAGKGIADFGSSISKAFTDAGGGFSGFVAAAGKIVPAVAGAGFALIVLVGILGTATSALLLTAGAAAALVSTLAFGLVGAIAPLAGLLGPLGLAAGGVALAFIGMSDAAKESLKETFEPLKEQLKALGDAARPGILDGITAAAENLEAPMKRLEPLFKVVGESVGNFIDTVSKVSFGPGFEKFVDVMTRTMPSTMQSLGTVFGNTFDGLMGLFATLQPFVERFLDTSERISGSFADWSISADASNFFQRAADSAAALMDFLGPVWNLTQEILSAGKDTGDSLFKSMGDNIQGWVDALKANPDILKNFFEDAKKMGEALGNVVIQIGKMFDALDTPTTRDWAIGLVNAIGDIIGLIGDLIGWWNKLPGAVQGVTTAVLLGMTVFKRFGLAGGAAIGLLIDGFRRAGDTIGTFELLAGGALAGFAVGGPIGAGIGAVGGLIAGFVEHITHAGDASEKFRDDIAKPLVAHIDASAVQDLLELLAEAHGNYKLIAADSAAQAVESAAGGVEKLNEAIGLVGLRKDTIAEAFTGSPEAIGLVTDAMDKLNDNIATGAETVETFAGTSAAFMPEFKENLTAAYDAGLISQAKYTEGIKLFNDTQADQITSGEEYNDLIEYNSGVVDSATSKTKEYQEVLQTLTNITGSAASAQELLNQHNQEGIDLLGITDAQLRKLPKKVQTDIALNGAPETADQAMTLLQEFGKFLKYKDIKAVISAPGVDLTRKQIETLATKARLTPKQIKILLKAEGVGKAGRDIDKVGKKADDVTKKDRKVPIKADPKPFDESLARIKGQIGELPKKPAKAKFDGDTTKFDNKNQNVKNRLNETGNKVATPKITVNNEEALNKISAVQTAMNNLPTSKTITIHVNTVRTGGNPNTAAGGIFAGAQTRVIGEAGPEAVVPLNRSLSQVDPAVRELSAIAQGMRFASRQARPVASKTIDVGGIQIITPTKDPGAVATEVVNRLVAVGY